jgi:hypothetical protein
MKGITIGKKKTSSVTAERCASKYIATQREKVPKSPEKEISERAGYKTRGKGSDSGDTE